MKRARIVVLDGHTVNPGDASWEPLERLGELTVYAHTPLAAVVERSRGAHVLITNKTPVGAEVFQSVDGLAAICVLATGVNVVDIEAASARGVPVCNVPSYGVASVVEHTFALLFELCRAVGLHDAAVHRGEWSTSRDFSFWKTPQRQLSGRCLGVIGHGAIGSAVARAAQAFGMSVLATPSRSHPVGEGAATSDVDGILSAADVVTLHCPLSEATRELIRWDRLTRMKSTALLVNTARGGLIREADLARALEQGVLAGAALDVLAEEPPRPDNPLLSAPRCIVTPHLAWSTLEARLRLLEITAENVRGILQGRPVNVVNR